MDYRTYKTSRREKLCLLLVSVAGMLVISWLFYDCFWGIVLFPVLYLLIKKLWEKECIAKRKLLLTAEFIDGLHSVSTSLLAGYSLENAWKEAQQELALLHGRDSLLYREFVQMNRRISMNVPLEDLLYDLAVRSAIEDVMEFAEVFRFAKRGGGNMVAIIEATTERISGKFETEKEIEVAVAAKRLEGRLMNVIPLGILGYLKLSSAEYMSVLYGNPFGICFMSVCIGLYLTAIRLSGKVLAIHV